VIYRRVVMQDGKLIFLMIKSLLRRLPVLFAFALLNVTVSAMLILKYGGASHFTIICGGWSTQNCAGHLCIQFFSDKNGT